LIIDKGNLYSVERNIMEKELQFQATYANAKRAARVCLSNPESFSPVYVQVAVDRMRRAITEAAVSHHLEAGNAIETATSDLVVIDTNPCRE
jgi:hypothetical protein